MNHRFATKNDPLNMQCEKQMGRHLAQVEAGWAIVALDGVDAGFGLGEVAAGEQVATGLVGAWGDWLRDGELNTVILVGEPESSGGFTALSLPFGEVWEVAAGGGWDKSGAVYTGGLHGSWLDDVEAVTRRLLVNDRSWPRDEILTGTECCGECSLR